MTETWSAAYLAALAGPGEPLPFLPQPRSFTGVTVVQRVRLARGGDAVRLVLSNEFGREPLVIDRVTVDGRDAGAIVVEAGRTGVSGAVLSGVRENDEVDVGLSVCRGGVAGAFLHSAQRTGEAGGETFTSLYWIQQVQVRGAHERPVVVAFGDSITRGDGTTVDASQRYPDHLARLLGARAAVLNAGLGANRLLRRMYGPPMVDRFTRDVLDVPGVTQVVILGGTNDIGLPAVTGQQLPLAGDIVDGLTLLARRARRHGIAPTLATIPPMGPGRPQELRREVNAALREQGEWPVADLDEALRDPADPIRLLPAFDSGDGLHPSDKGAAALAAAVHDALPFS